MAAVAQIEVQVPSFVSRHCDWEKAEWPSSAHWKFTEMAFAEANQSLPVLTWLCVAYLRPGFVCHVCAKFA